MKIRNKITGQIFYTTVSDYEKTIVSAGASHKYEIVEDDKPVELKQLSVEIHKKKIGAKNK